jgi:6-phospho-3-hexuloisomerase
MAARRLAMTSFHDLAHGALAELAGVIEGFDAKGADALIEEIVKAKRIALHGLGREGLQMRGLAMRLFHMGLDVHVVGDMTLPPIGKGDLFIAAAGPGDIATTAELMKIAKSSGARLAVITAQGEGGAAKRSDCVLLIPAQTMANDRGGKTSVLPMGSLFEVSMMLVFEILVLKLRDRIGETAESMRARHTNLE